jgi:hypothetical protein
VHAISYCPPSLLPTQPLLLPVQQALTPTSSVNALGPRCHCRHLHASLGGWRAFQYRFAGELRAGGGTTHLPPIILTPSPIALRPRFWLVRWAALPHVCTHPGRDIKCGLLFSAHVHPAQVHAYVIMSGPPPASRGNMVLLCVPPHAFMVRVCFCLVPAAGWHANLYGVDEL